jgi:hypothetical protein
MRPIGLVLIVLGMVALIYQGFTYTTQKKVVDIGPIEVNRDSTRHVPISPIAGAGALIGGIALLAASKK